MGAWRTAKELAITEGEVRLGFEAGRDRDVDDAAIGVLIWTVRRCGIFPTQLNDLELISGSLALSHAIKASDG